MEIYLKYNAESEKYAHLVADALFAAAQENAQWRYKSYLRMLGTAW